MCKHIQSFPQSVVMIEVFSIPSLHVYSQAPPTYVEDSYLSYRHNYSYLRDLVRMFEVP